MLKVGGVRMGRVISASRRRLSGTLVWLVGLLVVSAALSVPAIHAQESTASPTLFYEDFENSDGSNWTQASGSWSIVNDNGNHVLKRDSMSAEGLLLAGSSSWDNYSVQMDVTFYNETPAGTRASGILARAADDKNFYLLRLNTTGSVELMRNLNGTYTRLTGTSYPFVIGQTYTMNLTVDHDQITGSMNGTEVLSASDPALSQGGIGFRAYNQLVGIDQVTVEAIGAPEVVDKTGLQSQLDAAAQLSVTHYTAQSWSELQSGLTVAASVYEDNDATQQEVNEATRRLQYFISMLFPVSGAPAAPIERVPFWMHDSNQAGWWTPLAEHDGATYMAYNTPSDRELFHHVAVAVRSSGGDWKRYLAANEAGIPESYINDPGHNQPSLAIDGNGQLHLFASMHNDTWRYFTLDTTDSSAQLLEASANMPDPNARITYPIVEVDSQGDLWLIVRLHESTRRPGILYHYDHTQREWSRIAEFASAEQRSVYPNDLKVDDEGNVHIVFEWALYPAAPMRHELSYIRYDAAAGIFTDASHNALPIPVTPATVDLIQPLLSDEDYNSNHGVQTAKLALDENDSPLVVYRQSSLSQPNHFVVKFARWDGIGWQCEVVFQETPTRAALDLTRVGSEIRLYYIRNTGADRVYAAVSNANGWQHLSIVPGLPADRLSVISNPSGKDILYLTNTTGKFLYYSTAFEVTDPLLLLDEMQLRINGYQQTQEIQLTLANQLDYRLTVIAQLIHQSAPSTLVEAYMRDFIHVITDPSVLAQGLISHSVSASLKEYAEEVIVINGHSPVGVSVLF